MRGLEKIAIGRVASDAVVKRALNVEQYENYLNSFNVDFSHTETDDIGEVSWKLHEYLSKVRDGDRYTRTANMFKHSKKRDGNGQTAYKRYLNKAEGSYESAVMWLINTVDLDPTRNPNSDRKVAAEILRCLDREVNPEPGHEPDASAQGVPRLRGTKSKYTQVAATPVVGQRRRKYVRQREALTQAAVQLLYAEVEEDVSTVSSEKLNTLLRSNVNDEC